MKILVTIILALWLTVETGLAQSFPNINLSGVPNSCLFNTNSLRTDQFANQGGDGCPTFPWFVSHGTPDIYEGREPGTRFIFVGSATKNNGRSDDGVRSEGVSYRQPFFKGKWYRINITFQGNVDKFRILLADGVPIAIANSAQRGASVPNVGATQELFNESVNSGTDFYTKDIVFIPNKDYESLWIFSEDSHNAPPDQLNGVTFRINSLVCDIASNEIIVSTLTTLDYGRPSGARYHQPLQPQMTASRILIHPNPLVRIKKKVARIIHVDQQCDAPVKLVSSRYIAISPRHGSPTQSYFEAEGGSVFSAQIDRNIGCIDACEGFLPWNNPYTAKLYSILLNSCGVYPFDRWQPLLLFPKPYNAYRAELIIVQQNKDLTSRWLFHKVWEDPQKRALPEGCVVWKPDQSFPAGVYSAWLILTNCDGEHVFKRNNGTLPEINVQCGHNGLQEIDQSLMQNSNETLLGNKNKSDMSSEKISFHKTELTNKNNASLLVAPNPTAGTIRLLSNSDLGKSVIRITDILGRNVVNLYNDNLSANSSTEYDISNLATGVYIISVESNNKIVYRTKINKL